MLKLHIDAVVDTGAGADYESKVGANEFFGSGCLNQFMSGLKI